ncbi:MAG: alpha/beta hydrolase [Myxococcales bacterium]|nr:alpha/beta hydrolase [Myxococcales bacterium]
MTRTNIRRDAMAVILGTGLLAPACEVEPGGSDEVTSGIASSDASTSGSGDTTAGTTAGTEPGTTTPEGTDTEGTETTTTGEPEQGRSLVLVHGAWMGAWSWDRVVPELEAAGHAVRVVELPAHGDDPTAPARASLEGYRDAVLAAMDDAGEPVVLVGHSMGGMVISAAAQARPGDVDALVYVAAYLPQDGQSLLDLAFMDPDSLVGQSLVDNGDGTTSIQSEAIGEVFCADCSPRDVMLLQQAHRPEPGAPLATPIALDDGAFGQVPRHYVRTAQDQAVSPALQEQMILASPVDAEVTLDTSHCPMLVDPSGLAEAIVGVL